MKKCFVWKVRSIILAALSTPRGYTVGGREREGVMVVMVVFIILGPARLLRNFAPFRQTSPLSEV